MGKCTCIFHAGDIFGKIAPRPSAEGLRKIDWPLLCTECNEEIKTPEQAGMIGDFSYENQNIRIKAACKTCMELVECFFCSCERGNLWSTLHKNYQKIGLGNLTELLSPEAKAILIEKVDQWFLEDNQEEDKE